MKRGGENVGMCRKKEDPLFTLLDDWIHSPPHNKNLLGEYNCVGLALFISDRTYFATALFAYVPGDAEPKPEVRLASQASLVQLLTDKELEKQDVGAVFVALNDIRTKAGIPPLTLNAPACEMEREQAKKMLKKKIPISNEGYKERISILGEFEYILPLIGDAKGQENNLGAIIDAWLKYPGFEKAMRKPFSDIGIASKRKGDSIVVSAIIFGNKE